MDLSAIKSALAAFDNKYYTPQMSSGIQISIPEPVDPEPVAERVEAQLPVWREHVKKYLSKFVTLKTFDPVNGEIFVSVVLPVILTFL